MSHDWWNWQVHHKSRVELAWMASPCKEKIRKERNGNGWTKKKGD
jgi:hypothetical protein